MLNARHLFGMVLFVLLLSFFAASEDTGNIHIICNPGINIYLDDETIGVTKEQDNGLLVPGLNPGIHKVRGENADFMPPEFEVSIKSEQTTRIKIGKDGAPMVLISAGDFQMGSKNGDSDEEPIHIVYLDSFYMDKYEVTNAQYAKFLNEYGKDTDDAGHKLLDIKIGDCMIKKDGNTYKPKPGHENYPVIAVSRYGAIAYAHFYGKKLPTEAQWEKAARGGLVGKRYPLGSSINHNDANYGGTGDKDQWDGISPVGEFPPNGYGLYDMAGNAWEWCADDYDPDYYNISPKDNPASPEKEVIFDNGDFIIENSYGVLRGGSWDNFLPYHLRTANRSPLNPAVSLKSTGLRCITQE